MNAEHGEGWSIYQCSYADLAALMRGAGVKADALIVDAPYSAKTHAGHDAGAETARSAGGRGDRDLSYDAWGPEDVSRFVDSFFGLVSGWWGSLTDHNLAPFWEKSLGASGFYTFTPIPAIEHGATVRQVGDGPPSWTTRLVTAAIDDERDDVTDLLVARPKGPPWSRWTVRVDREARQARPVPGYYLVRKERKPVVGGKSVALMREIVGDYSAPGALVLDPCAGGGTTLVAAIQIGRRAIGCEPDAGRFAIAVERLRAAEKEKMTP